MQVGVQCIRGKVLHSDCRLCSLQPLHPCDYPAEMIESTRVFDPHRTEFTPSSLLECDRRSALKTGNDYFEDIESLMNKQRGTIFHAGLDQTCRYPEGSIVDEIKEVRLTTKVPTTYGDQIFSGKSDLVVVKRIEDGVAYCKVVDYKTKKTIPTEFPLGERDYAQYRKHVMQLNMYAWLVERELLSVPLVPKDHCAFFLTPVNKVVVEELEIIYMDMKKVRRLTSAGSLQTQGKRVAPGEYETLTLPAITLLPMETTGTFIALRIEEKIKAKEELPPILEGSRAIECINCAIKERCYEIG